MLVIEDRGRRACKRPLASEADLVRHQEAEVENPVMEVIEQLSKIPAARERFTLGDGIIFKNHTNTLTEESGQVQQSSSRQPRTDQNCVYLRNGIDRSLLYIIEYKAGHKLSDEYLRSGLHPMNIWDDVVQRFTIPTDPIEKLQYNAELLSAAAVTQAFEYMIKGGLEYSCLTNGRMKVISRILEEDPATLHYCLLEPSRDAEPDADGYGFRYPYTAISYQLGLTLMALQTPQRSQIWRNDAMRRLKRWEMDFEEAVRSIPEPERKQSPPDSDYRAPSYPLDIRSPYLLRRRLGLEEPNPTRLSDRYSSPDLSSDSDTGPADLTSSPIPAMERRKQKGASNPLPRRSEASRQPNRQYCTQKCLLGISQKSTLDYRCLNVLLHQKQSSGLRHPITRSGLIQLVERQLNQDPDHGCCPLGREGIHGALFAITLAKYGYTFVGKGN